MAQICTVHSLTRIPLAVCLVSPDEVSLPSGTPQPVRFVAPGTGITISDTCTVTAYPTGTHDLLIETGKAAQCVHRHWFGFALLLNFTQLGTYSMRTKRRKKHINKEKKKKKHQNMFRKSRNLSIRLSKLIFFLIFTML